ncbi:hypothetical protein AB0J21_32690 [Streptomyces sp. NPDC049954]|uniref:hypothetical protein n=1 Tax=Streptomyces sp. NPDC049954 TaxID=3155779 RepID=UPI0034330C79
MPTTPRVPPARRVVADLAGADYASAFTVPAAGLDSRTAAYWARAVVLGAPFPVRWALLAGWRHVLGLRLAPTYAPGHVLGWPVEQDEPGAITLRARSPLLLARSTVSVDAVGLTWTTRVHFERRAGRTVWAAAAQVHHRLLPLLLRRAVRREA